VRTGPILIVEDDLDIRELLAETLESLGVPCVTAENGLRAIELAHTMATPPSMILLDLMMPVMDGYGFLELRKKDPALAAIPVAIVTAGHGVDRSRLEGATPIIPKPINVPKLLDVILDLRSRGPRK
jgi:CheY-like chemotaxis protein